MQVQRGGEHIEVQDYREMESMSKLLKAGKQNVRSLAKVKARNKTCSAKLLAPYCYGRCRNQGELATL